MGFNSCKTKLNLKQIIWIWFKSDMSDKQKGKDISIYFDNNSVGREN